MPTLRVNGCDYHYVLEGEGPETVVLGHGYLMTHRQWDGLARTLRPHFSVLRFDWRGQGQSEVTVGGYDPWVLASDVAQLTAALKIDRFHYLAHSMGGYVGYRLALRDGHRLASLALIATHAGATPPAEVARYTRLLWALRLVGYGPVIPRALPLIYGPAFLKAGGAALATQVAHIRSNNRTGLFRAGQGIFSRDSVTHRLGEITTPTLVVAAEHDVPHPTAQARADAAALPHARLVELEGIGHTPPAEAPDRLADLVLEFLKAHPYA